MARPRRAAVASPAVVLAATLLAACGGAAIDPTAVADAQTAARVKTALVNDPEVGEFAIEVRVVRGVAHLTGRVRTPAHADRAIGLARAVAGVAEVRPSLQIGGEPPPVPGEAPPPGGREFESQEIDTGAGPGLLAVGASISGSVPRGEALRSRVSFGPLFRLGSARGLGPAIGFDWFKADLESVDGEATLTRVSIKPVMVGLGYALASERVTVTPSVVGGYAFNSLTVTETGAAGGLPVEVSNSFVWRVGLSAWFDTSRRTALNLSVGYLMTGLRLTVLDGGRLARRDASGDTVVVHAGVAYKLF